MTLTTPKRVRPSTPTRLYGPENGVQLKIWRDTRLKLRELSDLTGKAMAVLVDELVEARLQDEYDRRGITE